MHVSINPLLIWFPCRLCCESQYQSWNGVFFQPSALSHDRSKWNHQSRPRAPHYSSDWRFGCAVVVMWWENRPGPFRCEIYENAPNIQRYYLCAKYGCRRRGKIIALECIHHVQSSVPARGKHEINVNLRVIVQYHYRTETIIGVDRRHCVH